MTPTPQSDPSTERNLTVKQKRAAQRVKKLEAYKLQQKQSARRRRIGLVAGVVAGIVVVGGLVTSIVLTPQAPKYTAGGDGATIEGAETFTNAANHVQTPVTYQQTPPAGGDHNQAWLNCGIYSESVPNENAVHSLEHGAIWVTYDPSLEAGELDTLKSKLPSTYVVMSPYEDLPARVVLSGWNVQLQVDSLSDQRIPAFFEEYWKGGTAPEPGASCTGAVDGPGKQP